MQPVTNEILKDYRTSLRRAKKAGKPHQSFESFRRAWLAEDEADGVAYERHIRSMTSVSRYAS